jgi:excisionase family DNA binding protein
VALRIEGIDPMHATLADVKRAMHPTQRAQHLPWVERILLPVVPIVCDLIGVSKAQVYRLAEQGKLEFVRSGGRTCATTASVVRYLDQVRAAGWAAPVQPAQLVRARIRQATGPPARDCRTPADLPPDGGPGSG